MIIISLAKVLSGDIGVCKHEDGDYDQKSANCQKKIFEGVILLHLDDLLDETFSLEGIRLSCNH